MYFKTATSIICQCLFLGSAYDEGEGEGTRGGGEGRQEESILIQLKIVKSSPHRLLASVQILCTRFCHFLTKQVTFFCLILYYTSRLTFLSQHCVEFVS